MSFANRASKVFHSLMLGAAVVALAVPMSGAAEQKQDSDLQVGTGMICDTQRQIERLAVLLDNGPQEAAMTVNAEEKDPNACGYATIAYMQGSPISTTRSKQGAFNIVRITVVGVGTPQGFQVVSPIGYFSLVKIEEIEV